MSEIYNTAAATATKAGDAAHKRDIASLHNLAASQHRIAAEHAYQDGDEAKEKEHRQKAAMHADAAYSSTAKAHPDTKKGGEELTGKDIHLGAIAKGEFKAGKNPPSFVDDESTWDKAKTAASKTYDMDDDAFWPVVTTVYQQMGGGIKHEAKARLATARLGALSARRMSQNVKLEASVKGSGYSLSDLQSEIAEACKDLDQFSVEEGACGPCPWVPDIIVPKHEEGETWEAVVGFGNGIYCVKFKITSDHEVELVGDPEPVTRTTDYEYVGGMEAEAKRADAAAWLEASNPEGINQYTEAGKSASSMSAYEKSADANAATRKAESSGKSEDHDAAAKAHYEASKAHMTAKMNHNEGGKPLDDIGANSANRAMEHNDAAVRHSYMSEGHESKAGKIRGTNTKAKSAADSGLQAADFKGNQHQSASDVADEHSAAARVASRTANKASKAAKPGDKSSNDAAASMNRAAQAAHETAAAKQKACGNEEEAEDHYAKANKHALKAEEHSEDMAQGDGDVDAKSAVKKNAEGPFALACHCSGANPVRSWLPQPGTALDAARAASPTVDNVLQYMPAGIHSITPSQDGEPVNVTVLVDIDACNKIEDQRRSLDAGGKKPFFSVQHETEIAAFWPSRFFWDERIDATGRLSEGIWVEGEWTKSGRESVEGKDFRTFSPTFFVDAVRNTPERPARIVCNENARANMGALENDPAFQTISPLWCRSGGGSKKPDEVKTMIRDCHNAIKASGRMTVTLDEVRHELFGKYKVKLTTSEVGALLID